MELVDIATELYGLVPEEFTAARNERAKTARAQGERALAEDVRRLRKPSTAAWVVNMLARRRGDDLDRVVDVGARLRRAQEEHDADELRALSRRRQEVLAAMTGLARTLGDDLDHPVSASVATEVEQTLRAAMADPAAAAAVCSGRLTGTLEATGLGTVDVSDAVAVPSALEPVAEHTRPPRREQPTKPTRAQQKTREKADAAEREATDAEERLTEAQRGLDRASAQHQELEGEREHLQRRLRDLERDSGQAEREVQRAQRERDKAQRLADSARRTAERAREDADRGQGGTAG